MRILCFDAVLSGAGTASNLNLSIKSGTVKYAIVMYTPEQKGDNRPEDKKPHGEKQPQKEENTQHREESARITPHDPESAPKDTVRDAKDRWDSESPAVKGQPNRTIPEGEGHTSPEEDEDDLLKKRDESGVA